MFGELATDTISTNEDKRTERFNIEVTSFNKDNQYEKSQKLCGKESFETTMGASSSVAEPNSYMLPFRTLSNGPNNK